jgi:hypothetical protein
MKDLEYIQYIEGAGSDHRPYFVHVTDSFDGRERAFRIGELQDQEQLKKSDILKFKKKMEMRLMEAIDQLSCIKRQINITDSILRDEYKRGYIKNEE